MTAPDRIFYRGMDRAKLDAAYNNSAAVANYSAIKADWHARSARVRQSRGNHLDLKYGVNNTPGPEHFGSELLSAAL